MPTFETLVTPEMTDAFTQAGSWRNTLAIDALDEYARSTPDKLAFVDSRGTMTFAQLRTRSIRCAHALRAHGVEPGDVVSIQVPNWNEWIVVHYACIRIGAVLNPLIPIYRDREIGFMMELAESRIVIVPADFRGFDHPGMIDRLRGNLPALEHVVVIDGQPEGSIAWDDFMATGQDDEGDLAELRPDPNEVTLLIFTSGTTGEPKGVMHTHNTVDAAIAPLPERLSITSDEVFHMASTLGHLTGFLYGARLGVSNGATTVLQDVWNAPEFIDLIEKHGITYTSGATPFLHDLVAQDVDGRTVDSLRIFACMGAPIPRALVREAREKLPAMTVLGGWGQSENGLVTLGIPGDPEDKIVETDGYPWPGMEVRTMQLDGSGEVPEGEEGDLQVRGPALFVGYAKRMEMTRDSLVDDGWFRTGDLAEISGGYVNIVGRTKDVIIRGGENIPVVYVENTLYEHPDVAVVAVVAVPDPRLQERAACCLVMKEGREPLTLPDIQEFLRSRGVTKGYWPEHLTVLEDFPRTPSGKIQKFKLRQQLIAEL